MTIVVVEDIYWGFILSVLCKNNRINVNTLFGKQIIECILGRVTCNYMGSQGSSVVVMYLNIGRDRQ